jgi:glyoxylase-like metal-dependent hydrolase (beta-lactamase superfamily II)
MRWKVGRCTIERIVEQEWEIPLETVLNDPPPGCTARHPWLQPRFLVDDTTCRLAVQGFVVDDRGTRVLVDTCVGESESAPGAHPAFLARLAEAGYQPEDIDVVVCTHMHFDHVGWNTRLVGGRWTVTFPSAEYLFSRTEWEQWESEASPLVNLDERIRPVLESGQARLVETTHEVSEAIRLVPTPGHTLGHVSVMVADEGSSAVITGDMVHHPVQLAEPDVGSVADTDAHAAVETRRRCLAEWAEGEVLVVGTHFAVPTAGRVETHGSGWRLLPPRQADRTGARPAPTEQKEQKQ